MAMKLPDRVDTDVMSALKRAHWGKQYVSAVLGEEAVGEALSACSDPECSICAVIVCPFHEPMHFHHDGCPSCYSMQEELGQIARKAYLQAGDNNFKHPKAWEDMPEGERETYRRIGWAVMLHLVGEAGE